MNDGLSAPNNPGEARVKYKVEKYYAVDYGELEKEIKTTYGREFSVPADLECANDTIHRFVVKRKPLSKWDKEELRRFVDGENPSYLLYTLMQDLVNREAIPAGNWLVEVCW